MITIEDIKQLQPSKHKKLAYTIYLPDEIGNKLDRICKKSGLSRNKVVESLIILSDEE